VEIEFGACHNFSILMTACLPWSMDSWGHGFTSTEEGAFPFSMLPFCWHMANNHDCLQQYTLQGLGCLIW
jgi:hypothetical protein